MPGTVDFKQRISRQRPHDRESFGHAGEDDLQEIVYQLESDRGRIINSAAVRRLQQKTQVFPLERNAAVRSRLTHSLEVQQTGRFIVRTLFAQLGPGAAEVGLDGLEGALESLVEMACLMHDIGNPPFGHFGEFAINDWFERNLDGLFQRRVPPGQGDAPLQQRMLTDLKHFEGNAQAIRLVVKLLRLNLTYTQTAGLLKYVRPAHEPRPDKAAPNHYLNKKPGFYLSEEAFVGDLRQALGMRPGTRHPVAYIMEAADDISYCLADIEDSVEKGILGIGQLADLLVDKFAVHQSPDAPVPGDREGMSFRRMVAYSLEKAEQEPINKVSEFFIRLLLMQLLLCTAIGGFYGPAPTAVAEQFPVRVRSTGLAVGYNLAVMLFGGFAPFIVTWLSEVGGSPVAPAFYVLGAAFLGLLATLYLREGATPAPRAPQPVLGKPARSL
ncbi:dGTPase [Pseudomonas aeruginosa]|nr:dGTPase [Pseudomonas aeruginosa]